MNVLSIEKQTLVLAMLVEGMSLRSISRVIGINVNTIMRISNDMGEAARWHHGAIEKLQCKRIQVDELWAFCNTKNKNLSLDDRLNPGKGTLWTWIAICPDTKLIASWYVGGRGMDTAVDFLTDLESRLGGRVQLSSDGHRAYTEAVDRVFGLDVDYGQVVKSYGGKTDPDTIKPSDRYTGAEYTPIIGNPDLKHISTSICERFNLTLRMGNRRYTRKTNAHSKKIESHVKSVAMFIMHYNFARVHKTLRVTPAMEAGLADHVWSLEDMVKLIQPEQPRKRGPYKPRKNTKLSANSSQSVSH